MIVEKIFAGESVRVSIASRIDTPTSFQLRGELSAIPDTVKKLCLILATLATFRRAEFANCLFAKKIS
ncbi:MAG: hypothetical protein IJS29_01170 [Selenomonadaceae bacterium]|nr:hypothetical protein [Selenomonadaceae bacterium]